MPAKKRTSTKNLQSAVPQQPAISEFFLMFTRRFLTYAKCLSGEQQHDDPLQLAFEVFVGWPDEFWMRHQKQVVVAPLDDHAFRQLLAQAHEAATRVLMRESRSRGLDSSAIWTASRFAREAILSRTNFHLPPGGWSRPWPECLGDELRAMPDWQQKAIAESDAALTQLGTMLDSKPSSKNTADATREHDDLGNEERALALLILHTDWSQVKMAQAVGVSRTTLYRFPRYQAAREVLQTGRADIPRGSKDSDGNLEAWERDTLRDTDD